MVAHQQQRDPTLEHPHITSTYQRASRAKLLCTAKPPHTFVVAVHCCFDDTLHSYTLSRSLLVSLAPPASHRPAHTILHTVCVCVFGVLLLPFASIGFTPIASHELSCSCQIEVTRCEAKQLGACTQPELNVLAITESFEIRQKFRALVAPAKNHCPLPHTVVYPTPGPSVRQACSHIRVIGERCDSVCVPVSAD